MSQEQPVAEQAMASDVVAKEEKKPSILKKVKDKAKRLGSKLKHKGHDHDDEAKKRELVDQSTPGAEAEDEEEEELTDENDNDAKIDSKDLNVPLDEFALIKQKEAENRDQEASGGKSGLEDNLTDGLSSKAIAEQPEESQALQAVPTEYHYKGDSSSEPPSESQSKEIGVTEDKPSEKDNVTPTEEEPRAPAVSPEGVFASGPGEGASVPEFSSKDIDELSSSNLYTGEPDVKPNKDTEPAPPTEESQQPRDVNSESEKTAEASKEVPDVAEKTEHESQSGVMASERGEPGNVMDATGEDKQELKDRDVSAETKLGEESAANANSADDNAKDESQAAQKTDLEKKPVEEGKPAESSDIGDKPAAAETETTNREVQDTNSFADAKPEMESADKALKSDRDADNLNAQNEVKQEIKPTEGSSKVSTEPRAQESHGPQDKKDEVSPRDAPETKDEEIPVSEPPRGDEKLETGSNKQEEENPSKENEPPASTENSPGIWQKLTNFKDNITGGSKPADENQDIKAEQDRIIDEKAKEVV